MSWPYDSGDRQQNWSVMNYASAPPNNLTPFDIAALQYLYGRPGENDGLARQASSSDGPIVQTLPNARPTAFTISSNGKTIMAQGQRDRFLADIRIEDDGLGMALPMLSGNTQYIFELVGGGSHWKLQLKTNYFHDVQERQTYEATINSCQWAWPSRHG